MPGRRRERSRHPVPMPPPGALSPSWMSATVAGPAGVREARQARPLREADRRVARVRATAARACVGGRAGPGWGTSGWASGTMLPRFRRPDEPRRDHRIRRIHATVGSDVRRPKVVASMALIAILAMVAVPGPVGSRVPSPASTVDPGLFHRVEVAALARGTAMTIQPQDPGARSAGNLDHGSSLIEPGLRYEPSLAPVRPPQRVATPGTISKVPLSPWRHDRNISWYGPGLYGHGTACGQTLTKTLVGCRPPDAAVRHAGHLPLQRRDADRSGHRSRPVRVRSHLGPQPRRLRQARALLHRDHRLEARLTLLTPGPRNAPTPAGGVGETGASRRT